MGNGSLKSRLASHLIDLGEFAPLPQLGTELPEPEDTKEATSSQASNEGATSINPEIVEKWLREVYCCTRESTAKECYCLIR
jgi:hypothetical protein